MIEFLISPSPLRRKLVRNIFWLKNLKLVRNADNFLGLDFLGGLKPWRKRFVGKSFGFTKEFAEKFVGDFLKKSQANEKVHLKSALQNLGMKNSEGGHFSNCNRERVLERYPEICDRSRKVLSSLPERLYRTPKRVLSNSQRFCRTPILAPEKAQQNPSAKVFRTRDRGLSDLWLGTPPFQVTLSKLSLCN